MLDKDLPEWLAYHDLAATPFAALGIAEGGMGALTYARDTPGVRAVAAISPTLYEDWTYAAASKDYQGDRAKWEAIEPLRHTDELSGVKVGVWCGTEDNVFIDTSKDLVSKVGGKGHWTPGGHDDAYWKGVLPKALKFIGEQL